MQIIGYGICGPGEASRYMRATMEEFKRLCDKTIILCNNVTAAEKALISEYGFKIVEDDREWGKEQWRIKQEFLENEVARIARPGDMMVCLDMDELLDKHCTREWLSAAPLEAYHVYVVDLWDEGYKPESCFWNVRLWKWNGNTKFREKPVHCGLAPEWAYFYHRFAPFMLKHYGLKDKADRMRKIARYEKYDPTGKWLSKKHYDTYRSDKSVPFDEEKLHNIISDEVASYKQTKPKQMTTTQPKKRFAFVRNPAGVIIDIPDYTVEETLRRKGFEFVRWTDEEEHLQTVKAPEPAEQIGNKCGICGKECESETALEAHKEKVHSPEPVITDKEMTAAINVLKTDKGPEEAPAAEPKSKPKSKPKSTKAKK